MFNLLRYYLVFVLGIYFSITASAQVSSANIYWVGHSLMDHTDYYVYGSQNMLNLVEDFAQHHSYTYNDHRHITPGAPIGWNWGATPSAWSSMQTVISPLIDAAHPDYGTFDVMVVTEGVNLEVSYQYWNSGFYARRFFASAKAANPATRLYLYESWHHFHAGDPEYDDEYGNQADFDWDAYMTNIRPLWNTIADEASTPAIDANPPADYTFQGTGADPGISTSNFTVWTVPVGEVLQAVFNRLADNLPTDDWSYTGGYNGTTLLPIDFFANPYVNFPTDLSTTVHAPNPIDDIHASTVLAYLNALTHFAVVYQTNPNGLPALNGVPTNVASIFQEVVWDVVAGHPRTGVASPLPVDWLSFTAKINDDIAILNWETTYEENNDGFEVEYSSDDQLWSSIAFVAPNATNKYTYRHKVNDGINYYRIKQTDFDGKFTYSPVRTLLHASKTAVVLFPNPVTNKLYFSNRIDKAEIYNLQGKHYLTAYSTNELDCSALNAGIYVCVYHKNGEMYRELIVVD